jgi:hypothetical protein
MVRLGDCAFNVNSRVNAKGCWQVPNVEPRMIMGYWHKVPLHDLAADTNSIFVPELPEKSEYR